MNEEVHGICLFLVFHSHIQATLNYIQDTLNYHKLHTKQIAPSLTLYELSYKTAINQGYWTGDPGDPVEEVNTNPAYSVDQHTSVPLRQR